MRRKTFFLMSVILVLMGNGLLRANGLPVVDAPADMPEDTGKVILYKAFSHNDYWRPNPLFDALSLRFNCVEADLWLVDGELMVAHDRTEIQQARTFQNLYLKPLIERVRANGGKVFPTSDRPFLLMVDCKTNGEAMYPVLKKVMEPYKDYFCKVEDGKLIEGAILFFLSGDRPLESLPNESNRFIFLDGRIKDLDQCIPATVMPVISDNYPNFFSWRGEGEMPADELHKLRNLLMKTHTEGKLLRWWGAPDTKQFKRFFLQEGLDLIGTDDLQLLYDVMTSDAEK